jgi:hypothetical protein
LPTPPPTAPFGHFSGEQKKKEIRPLVHHFWQFFLPKSASKSILTPENMLAGIGKPNPRLQFL